MTSSPKIVPTNQIPHEEIDPDALKVIRRLRRFGHEAYLVGGCVRDLLLDAHPKDFDVITSARPRQVRRIFSNSRVIGRRFRLVHVIFGQNIIEVSTFRADPGQFVEKAELVAGENGSGEGAVENGIEGGEDATPAPLATTPLPPPGEPTPVPPVSPLSDLGPIEPPSDLPLVPSAGESGRLVGIRPDTVPGADAIGVEPLEASGTTAPVTPLEAAHQASEESLAAHDLEASSHATRASSVDPRLTPAPRRVARGDDDLDEEGEDEDWDERRGRRRRPRPEFDGNNIFGTPEEDARRRDFTINALFYDPERREIIDYVDGLVDIERGLVNPINDPLVSFAEDPVRMIRAVRFAAKLEFAIEKRALDAIIAKRDLITSCSQRRILEEIFKILKGGHAAASLRTLEETGILSTLLPEIGEWFGQEPVPASLPGENGKIVAATPPPPLPAAPTTVTVSEPVAPVATTNASATEPAVAIATPVTPAPLAASEPALATTPVAAPTEASAIAVPPAAPAEPAKEAEIKLGPIPSWEPPQKAIEAYLRVTWEHPPKEGPNDWVEDPHEEVQDAIFEAAAFARDAVLHRFGFDDLVGLPSERARARAVMKVLQLNSRLQDAIAWVEEQARVDEAVSSSRFRRHHRRDRHRSAPPPKPPVAVAVAGPSASTAQRRPPVSRREVLTRYLEGLDKLIVEGVPLTTGVHLAALYGPMLREILDRALERRDRHTGSAETIIDDIMRPIALRHSLARRDRDRVKRIVLSMRRLLRDAPQLRGSRRRRSRGGQRLLLKDHFQEALVVLWLHARATGEGWESFRHWQARALEEKRHHEARRHEPRREDDDEGDDDDGGDDDGFGEGE